MAANMAAKNKFSMHYLYMYHAPFYLL